MTVLSVPSISSSSSSKDRWQPLAKIQYGFAISPFVPEADVLPRAEEVLDEPSTIALQANLIGLDVGDEVYIFEQLGTHDAEWFRGYVVGSTRTTAATVASMASSSPVNASKGFASATETALVEEPQVFVGVFPSAHVHIREQLDDAENRLADLHAEAMLASKTSSSAAMHSQSSSGSLGKPQMETLPEEDETSLPNSPSTGFERLGAGLRSSNSSRSSSPDGTATGSKQQHRRSVLGPSPQDGSGKTRPMPPLPNLKCGDETAHGVKEPLVDEIACAVREWSSLLWTYLARRQYDLFRSVKEDIEALQSARRQLLAAKLSEEEVTRLRKECVARLVKGNIAQGLDVIVRHPAKGGLIDLNHSHKADLDLDNWISGVHVYAIQAALAYVGQRQDPASRSSVTTLDGVPGSTFDISSPALTSTGSMRGRSIRDPLAGRGASRLSVSAATSFADAKSTAANSTNTAAATVTPSVMYYHVSLEIRALVASPCAPGETAERYVSLYNKSGARFLTEEFCLILNHHGVPARDSTTMKALFTELSPNDMADLHVVCRIIRNGSMRISPVTDRTPADETTPAVTESKALANIEMHDGPLGGSPGFRPNRMTADGAFRRPFGCAVLSLGQDHQFDPDTVSSSTKKEHTMPIFAPNSEAAFSTLHQDIIASRTREFQKSPRADSIVIDVKVFHGETAGLVKEYPTLLSDAAVTARLGFPDVVFPGDTRNEAYIKLWSGDFHTSGTSKIPGTATAKNLQVSIEVRTRDGRVLDGVISRGTGQPPVTQFDSTVFYHQNAPTWGELIKLRLPDGVITEQCHLFLTFRHRTSKEEKLAGDRMMSPSANGNQNYNAGSMSRQPIEYAVSLPFAHAYLPLFSSEAAFIPDGSHTLLLWRAAKPTQQISPEIYFSLPPTISSSQLSHDIVPPSLANLIQPLRDHLILRSFLVSTKYTQNDILLQLLRWEQIINESGGQGLEILKSILVKFTFIGEVEIVKFLRDIFDSLFSIVVHPQNSKGELDDLILSALVTVLSIVSDRRFNNFRATLDVYLDKHFHAQSAHSRLLASMARLLADPDRADTSKELRASIKVWPYLWRFIIRGRQNQRRANLGSSSLGGGALDDHFETRFKSELDSLLRCINRLMATTSPPSIVGTQALALQYFAGILPDLAEVYTLEGLVDIEIAFTDSIFITKGRMVVWKLLHLVHVAGGPLFDDHTSRSKLIPSVVRWIRPHVGSLPSEAEATAGQQEAARDAARISWLESVRLAMSVLAVTLDRLQTSLTHGHQGALTQAEIRQEQDNVDYILSMVPKMLETYKEMKSPESLRAIRNHRSPSTVVSSTPVLFPSSYPFPLVAKTPEHDGSTGKTKSLMALNDSTPASQVAQDFLHCGLGEIAAILTMLVILSPRKHLSGLFEEQLDLEGPEKLSTFVIDFCEVGTSILLHEAFPSSWLSINILAHQMILKMSDPIAALLVREFIPPQNQSADFDVDLWKAAFQMLLTLLSSDQLVIESFRPQRRRAVWRLAGDIRGEGAQIFAKLWDAIGAPDSIRSEDRDVGRLSNGSHQVHFIPLLVEPVVNLCLSHHDELRSYAVQVLATMITSEWHASGNFKAIEAEMIDKLDVLFANDTKGDEISRSFFIGQLRSAFDGPEVDEKLQEQVAICLGSVSRFLDLSLSVRNLPAEEGYQDERIAGTLKLLGFLRQANRVSAFSSHVLRLVNLHLKAQDYVEAALTLKLYSDLHSWDLDSFVDPMPSLCLPRQSHFARRETLYMLILDYLGKGQAWEISIDICRELVEQYEYRAIDYSTLSDVLAYQASLYRKIATIDRAYPSYFCVTYHGNGWPASLQEKMFIYRGLEWEKYVSFCERLLQKHPHALLINAGNNDDTARRSEGQSLQVTAVQPDPDKTRDVFLKQDVPDGVRAYYEHNATDRFWFTRPRSTPEGSSSQQEGLAQAWAQRTYLRCEDAFPTVLRRSEVAAVETFDISPLENAVNDVEAKTKELKTLETRFNALEEVGATALANGKLNTNRLAMALNGAVDAPINGGISYYRRSFLSSDADGSDPSRKEWIERLRTAIDAQALVIHRCIKLHARLCPPEMRPFHSTLCTFFEQNFREEISKLGLGGSNTRQDGDTASSETSRTEVGGRRFGWVNGLQDDPTATERPQRADQHHRLDSHGRLVRTGALLSSEMQESTLEPSPLQQHIGFLAKRSRSGTAAEAPIVAALESVSGVVGSVQQPPAASTHIPRESNNTVSPINDAYYIPNRSHSGLTQSSTTTLGAHMSAGQTSILGDANSSRTGSRSLFSKGLVQTNSSSSNNEARFNSVGSSAGGRLGRLMSVKGRK